MIYFNVPADFRKETIEKYDQLNRSYENAKVLETYGNITVGDIVQSGRAKQNIPEVDLEQLADYIKFSKQKGIGFNYTFNCTTLNNQDLTTDGIKRIKNTLQQLYDAGVRVIILALPTLIEIVKSMNLDFKIKASVLCGITTANKALKYKEIGVDKIVPDESIQRDFSTLKRIRRVFGEKVELIVNPLCNADCKYRTFHYNQLSLENNESSNKISQSYYPNRCLAQYYNDISSVFRVNWIRPEDLKYYIEIGINYFKLQGRHNISLKFGENKEINGDIYKVVEAYFKESFDGDLNDLIFSFNPVYKTFRVPIENKKLDNFLKPFVKNENFCARDCSICEYCDNYAKSVIDENKLKNTQENIESYFRLRDEFRNEIWSEDDNPPQKFPL